VQLKLNNLGRTVDAVRRFDKLRLPFGLQKKAVEDPIADRLKRLKKDQTDYVGNFI
jgi:hypothetical protein